MNRFRVLIISVLLILMVVALTLLAGETIFMVKKIEINKDFTIENRRLANYLEVTPVRSLWSYNLSRIKQKALGLNFVERCTVYKKYPNRLIINLYYRKPVGYISGSNGVFVFDREGVVFRNLSTVPLEMPLIRMPAFITVSQDTRLNSVFLQFFSALDNIKIGFPMIYRSLSEVVIENNIMGGYDYLLKIKGMDNYIYLKNFINTDDIVLSAAFNRYIESRNIVTDGAIFNGNGFVYKEMER